MHGAGIMKCFRAAILHPPSLELPTLTTLCGKDVLVNCFYSHLYDSALFNITEIEVYDTLTYSLNKIRFPVPCPCMLSVTFTLD